MRITSLHLKNWEVFRGEHELALEAKTYAITARRVEDPDRSSWSGKSSLMRAVVFALYGAHGHRNADGWISRGEKSGEVSVTFDDGTRVVRSRVSPAATKVYWHAPAISMGDEAEKAIVRAVGLTEEDFFASAYFEQRAMSRLVTMKPEPRMAIVSAWFRMEALQRAESIERNTVTDLVTRADATERAVSIQTEMRTRAFAAVNSKALDEMRLDLAGVERDLKAAQGAYESARGAIEANEARQVAADAQARLEAVTRDGKALAAEVEAEGRPVLTEADVETVEERANRLRAEAAGVEAERRVLDNELRAKRVLARGQFDGRCPVATIECPARSKINAMRGEHDKDVSRLMQASADADQAAHAAKQDADAAHADLQAYERKVARLESMRGEAARLIEQIERAGDGEPEDREKLRSGLDRVQQEVVELRTERDAYQRAIAEVEKADAELACLAEQKRAIAAELEAARASLAILGKQGTQRRLAEGALSEIEARAREMLVAANIPIEVAVRWARDGSGLAATCDACGAAYPTSAKVKACARCGAQRGPNIVNKLEIELSNRSGAADDLAGAAIQLAASAWLREDRGSAWSVAMLDEPFSSLDKSLRKSFASHLTAFLSQRYSVEQAFVISHTPDTVEQLPGRIEVVGDGAWSSARVVA